MKHVRRHIIIALLIFFSFTVDSALAGGSSQANGPKHFEPEAILDFSKKVEREMAKRGARVALVARLGRAREELPEGINFTHVGIAVYSQISTADGRKVPGYTMYNLYQRADEPDTSDLIRDFPADFFAGAKVLEAGVVIPTPELQRRILDVIVSPTYEQLHNPHYSVIANPFTLEFQNCTEHTLDVITAAIYETSDIEEIKRNEKAYFKPQPVAINPLKLMLGSMFIDDVATSDHPGSPVTTTFTTISRFLDKYGAASEILTITTES